jgi:hypothetical protein
LKGKLTSVHADRTEALSAQWTSMQTAANGRFPPFMSKCAWCSICCYPPLVSIDMNGP